MVLNSNVVSATFVISSFIEIGFGRAWALFWINILYQLDAKVLYFLQVIRSMIVLKLLKSTIIIQFQNEVMKKNVCLAFFAENFEMNVQENISYQCSQLFYFTYHLNLICLLLQICTYFQKYLPIHNCNYIDAKREITLLQMMKNVILKMSKIAIIKKFKLDHWNYSACNNSHNCQCQHWITFTLNLLH